MRTSTVLISSKLPKSKPQNYVAGTEPRAKYNSRSYSSSSVLSGSESVQRILNEREKRNHQHNQPSCQKYFSTTTTDQESVNKNNKNNMNKYQTNGGIIEGVWVFHRHGDRTPARSLVAPHMHEREASFWRTRIPPTDRSYFEALSCKFPTEIQLSPDVCSNNGSNGVPPTTSNTRNNKFLDADGERKREPYGFLTFRGMEQMRTLGKRFSVRYNQYGHHADKLLKSDGNGSADFDFLDYWNIQAYSTNYLRTVMSVQCFLDGLLGSSSSSSSVRSPNLPYESMTPEQYLQTSPYNSQHSASVTIRDRKLDTLNTFDRHPEFMRKLVTNVVTTPSFLQMDVKAAPLAARLANFLPGLSALSNYGGPSGINWIHAADHFVCRSSHELSYSQFSQFENDIRIEQTLEAMSHRTLAHLTWRFRQWYQSPPLLAAIAAPPLREIERRIRSTPSLGVHERRPFTIYSCHDVTILSLLYGIGADFVSRDEELVEVGIMSKDSIENMKDGDEGGGRWRFWPAYATTLVFELVRVKKGIDEDAHVIRVLLNGHPVRVLSTLKKAKEEQSNKGTEHQIGRHGAGRMLSLSDFSEIVDDLERKGGNEVREMICCDDNVNDDEKRGESDVSNWTG